MASMCDTTYDVKTKEMIWKTNFDLLQVAYEIARPVSLNIWGKDLTRYTGYITDVDPIKDTFTIEMPGEFVKTADIINAARIDLDIHSRIEISEGQKYKLWIDDIREVPTGLFGAKSVNEAIRIIELIESRGGTIELLDLDHDLGDFAKFGGDAIKLLDFLCERETFYPIAIHTANPVGRANMERMINRYWPE